MIKLSNIQKIYNKGKSNEFEALKDVSLTIKDGELVAVIGKSGAGKSTLLHIIACIDSYEDGKYVIDEQEAIIVKTVFELSAEGYGYKSIIEKLNEKLTQAFPDIDFYVASEESPCKTVV